MLLYCRKSVTLTTEPNSPETPYSEGGIYEVDDERAAILLSMGLEYFSANAEDEAEPEDEATTEEEAEAEAPVDEFVPDEEEEEEPDAPAGPMTLPTPGI